eukprot:scaffold57505_cov66-Cyclotella_meneghiniana.AAC.1
MADEVTTRALAALDAFSSSSSDEEDVIQKVQLRDRPNPLQDVNKDFQSSLAAKVVGDKKCTDRSEYPVKDKNSIQRHMPRFNATPPSATTSDNPISRAAKNKMEQIFQNHIRHNKHLGTVFPNEVGLAELITEAGLAELIIQYKISLEQLKKWFHTRIFIFNQNKSWRNDNVDKPNCIDISDNPMDHAQIVNRRQNNAGQVQSLIHPTANSKSTRTNKRKRENIAPSTMPSIEIPNNRTRINIFQHSISKDTLSRRVKLEKSEDIVIPHKLDSMYHDLTIYTSVPFDSRTMKNFHRAKEFNESLGLINDKELPILNQKEILRKHRDKRVDELEEKLLEEIEDEQLAISP